MTTLSPLAQELNDDPLGRGYAGMADSRAVAVDLDTQYRPIPLVSEEIIQYLIAMNLWAKIVADSEKESLPEDQRLACLDTVQALTMLPTFDLRDDNYAMRITSAIDFLYSEPGGWNYLYNPAAEPQLGDGPTQHAYHKAAILAMGDNRQARAQELGLGRVRWLEVDAAWAEIAEAGL